jgi:dihydrofolate reductase
MDTGTAQKWAVARRPVSRGRGVYLNATDRHRRRRTDMGQIIVSQNVTLDGVVQDPTGVAGFRHGGWLDQMSGSDREAWAEAETAEAFGADALLMGRLTYEYFVARGWPTRAGTWADRLRELPKYVVSSTLRNPEWGTCTVISGDVVEEVSKLRQNVNGEIVVYASHGLVPALMEHGLVDELRLIVHPFVLGAGERLFGETSDKTSLRLVDTQALGESLAFLRYEVVRDLPGTPPPGK